MFKVGDRMRSYHMSLVRDFNITEIDCDGMLRCQNLPDHSIYYFHPKQCRLLRPKKKPEESKRVERWINIYNDIELNTSFIGSYNSENDCYAGSISHQPFRTVRLVELKESEIIVSPDKIKQAWRIAGLCRPEDMASGFPEFCTALGIKAENEKGKA